MQALRVSRFASTVSLMGAPLIVERGVIGVVIVSSGHLSHFTQDELELLLKTAGGRA